MMLSRLLSVAAIMSISGGGGARAEVHRLECPDPAGHETPDRIIFDDTAGTITVNGRLFGNGHNRIYILEKGITWDLVLNTPRCLSDPSATETGGLWCSARFGSLTRDLLLENAGTAKERRCVSVPE